MTNTIPNSDQKSFLNLNATAFVPQQFKHRYDARGELRESPPKTSSSSGARDRSKSKHSVHSASGHSMQSVSPLNTRHGHTLSAAANPTFSSLYDDPKQANQRTVNQQGTVHKADNSFLAEMGYTAVSNVGSSGSNVSSSSSSATKWIYHLPDLSSPPIVNESGGSTAGQQRVDQRKYESMYQPYPANYTSHGHSPSPSSNREGLSSPSGFAIDLSTLGYNRSPSRVHQHYEDKKGTIQLPRQLAPKTDMEYSIEHSLNAMLEDEDELLTKDLFPVMTSTSSSKKERKKKKKKRSESVSPRLSELFE